MYIVDGVAYAGQQQKPVKVICVQPLGDYKLRLRFNTGDCGIFDASPLLEKEAFYPLKDKATFSQVFIDFGVLCWLNGEIDISPEFVLQNTILDSLARA